MARPSPLAELKLEITTRCPLQCQHCSSCAGPHGDVAVEPSVLEGVVKEFVALGGRRLMLSGGEPLAHPEWSAILAIIRRHEVAVSFYTTGICMPDLTILSARDADRLHAMQVDAVFSLHGSSPETHDACTGISGSFTATHAAINRCRQAGLEVSLHMVPMPSNYRMLPEMMALAERWEVRSVSLLRFVPQGRGALAMYQLGLTPEQMCELRQLVVHVQQLSPVQLRLGSPFRLFHLPSIPACTAGIDRLLITPHGDAFPCDAFKGFPFVDAVRNVYEYGLTKVWQQSNLLHRLRKIAHTLPTACQGCAYTQNCHGGCPAQRAYARGALDTCHRDPGCMISLIEGNSNE